MRRTTIWTACALGALLPIAIALVTVGDAPRQSVWTDGTTIRDAPNGNVVSVKTLVGIGSAPPPARGPIGIAEPMTWSHRARWAYRYPSLVWDGHARLVRTFIPVADTDVRDDKGVVWWRCDFAE